MPELDRYRARSTAFDKTISATQEHFLSGVSARHRVLRGRVLSSADYGPPPAGAETAAS
jgi:hypothetical protein